MLSEKQLQNWLEKYYLQVFGDSVFDEWHGGYIPNNVWRFDRAGQTITLICDPETGTVSHTVKHV